MTLPSLCRALALAGAALVALASSATAGQTVAVFPIDMSFPRTEDDFYFGARGPSPEEQKRLDLAQEALKTSLAERGGYEIVDLSSVAEDIKAAQPIYNCNGCELDIAAKAKAQFVLTAVVDKISETHLSLNLAIVDVAGAKIVKQGSVLIQGNTDEAWLHGVKWVTKNRLFPEGDKKQ